jgi:hypothetical protein
MYEAGSCRDECGAGGFVSRLSSVEVPSRRTIDQAEPSLFPKSIAIVLGQRNDPRALLKDEVRATGVGLTAPRDELAGNRQTAADQRRE